MGIDSLWQKSPLEPEFSKDELHIWRVSLLHTFFDKSFLSELSLDERSRAQRFVCNTDYWRFVLSHYALRHILSRYCFCAAKDIVFRFGSHGKPYLDSSAMKLNRTPWLNKLQFNMSHSGDWLACIIFLGCEVGVDLECWNHRVVIDSLVERFFSKCEQAQYATYLSSEEKRDAFYCAWTRKEAYLKATGLGLSFSLKDFDVSLNTDVQNAGLLAICGDSQEALKWTLSSFLFEPYYYAAFAVPAKIIRYQTFEWSF